jgi:hypothetical protein
MADPTTLHARMTRGWRRWIATHVLADSASLSASSAVDAQLAPARLRTYTAVKPTI